MCALEEVERRGDEPGAAGAQGAECRGWGWQLFTRAPHA